MAIIMISYYSYSAFLKQYTSLRLLLKEQWVNLFVAHGDPLEAEFWLYFLAYFLENTGIA